MKLHKETVIEVAFFVVMTILCLVLSARDWNHVLESEKEVLQKTTRASPGKEKEQDSGKEKVLQCRLQERKKTLQYRYIKECTLSKKVQRKIFDICAGANISFEFVMSLIQKESGWDAGCVSDNGESVGLMQIQGRWHRELMDKLGCTDLTDPVQNVRVGVELLKRHFNTYKEPVWVLMAYNGGQAYADRMIREGRISGYASEIMEQAEKFEKENGL